MNTPSSRHLSYEFKAYKGLTLRELFVVTLVTTISACMLFVIMGLLIGWAVILGCLGFLLGFIFAITVLPKPISRLKADKPHGYLLKQMLIRLSQFGMIQSPFIDYQGIWKTSQSVRDNRV